MRPLPTSTSRFRSWIRAPTGSVQQLDPCSNWIRAAAGSVHQLDPCTGLPVWDILAVLEAPVVFVDHLGEFQTVYCNSIRKVLKIELFLLYRNRRRRRKMQQFGFWKIFSKSWKLDQIVKEHSIDTYKSTPGIPDPHRPSKTASR